MCLEMIAEGEAITNSLIIGMKSHHAGKVMRNLAERSSRKNYFWKNNAKKIATFAK